jgi:hypothetical protein
MLLPIMTLWIGCSSSPTAATDASSDVPIVILDAVPDADASSATVACDVVAQNCPIGERCTILDELPQGRKNQCLPQTGAATVGASCTRRVFGDDDCDRGALCGTFADGDRCLALCDGDADCKGSDRCYSLGNGPDSRAGACLPTCTVFAHGCATNRQCGLYPDPDGTRLLPFCALAYGPFAKVGAACTFTFDCEEDAFCVGQPKPSVVHAHTGICRAMCDAAHVCASGVCTQLDGMPAAIGACL